ncbi:MAG: tetratricopeptide repeat protein [Thermoanaerobaculia bacterium]
MRAWSQGVVPHYVTSNPWIANAYAQVVFGWLRDWCGGPGLDPSRPVYLLELGCGSGRFAYLFLTRFFELLGSSHLAGQPVRYVLSDFTEYNLDVLRSHPALQPFVEAGLLDFARYDAGEDLELVLSQSGQRLGPEGTANPLAVLANYVFDGLPQDAFTLRAGRLHETLTTLTSKERQPDLEDPELLSRLVLEWKHRPASLPYYGEPELDGILAEYVQDLQATTLLFPLGALRCAQNLARLSGRRLLLLSGDKGHSSAASLAGQLPPGLALHGSFSLMVNLHALGRWFVRAGGEFLAPPSEGVTLNVVAGLLGEPPAGWVETRLAFEAAIGRGGPDDFYSVKKGIESCYAALSLDQLLAWLRLSGFDHNIFLGCLPSLLARLPEATERARQGLLAAVDRVWEGYFPLHEPQRLVSRLAELLLALGCPQRALEYAHRAAELEGENADLAVLAARCHLELGALEAARERVAAALEAEPDHSGALDLLPRLARRRRG